MSSPFGQQISKTAAKRRAYEAFSIYMRTLWNKPKGYIECYTCDNHTFLKERPGKRTMVGHWVEGHKNATYVKEDYVRPQCYKCNIMMGGNQGEFRDRIRKELGDKKVDQLLLEAKGTVTLSAKEWLDLQSYYKVKLQELDK